MPADSQAQLAGPRLDGLSVLAVDDEPDSLELVADALRDARGEGRQLGT